MDKKKIDGFNEEFLIKKSALSLVEKDNKLFDLLEKDNTLINPNQDELDKKIHSLINEQLGEGNIKSLKQHKLKKLLFKVATFVFVLTSGFVVPFVTVDAFREKVLNFYIENFDTHSSFKPKDENSTFMYFKVDYIPEGYVKSDEINTPSFYSEIFYNKDNYLIDITLYGDKASFNVDTENCEKLNITVNSKNGYIYRRRGLTSLIFTLHGNSIVITSTNDELINEELIKIAESIN